MKIAHEELASSAFGLGSGELRGGDQCRGEWVSKLVRDESHVLGFRPSRLVVTRVHVALNRGPYGRTDELGDGLRLLPGKETLVAGYLEQNAPQNDEFLDQLRNIEPETQSRGSVLLRNAYPQGSPVLVQA